MNFRLHPEFQRAAIQAIYREVGFARSLLAFELPDGRLKLIDGHLRRDIDPNMEVDVEVLDVNEEEARALLLSIDPLAALAETQHQLQDHLLELDAGDLARIASRVGGGRRCAGGTAALRAEEGRGANGGGAVAGDRHVPR